MGVATRIKNRIDELYDLVNSEDYNGMSEFYYHLSEDMPIHVSNVKWALNNLCYDMMPKKERDELNERINNLKY